MTKAAATARIRPRRDRWKIAEARSVLAALAASGLSLPEFARQKELQPQRLRAWRRRLAREVGRPAPATRRGRPAPVRAPAPPAPPALIELRPTASARGAEPIEIVLGWSGVTLRIAETIDPGTLVRLVTALRGC
jgi:hypothetical protein